jgi:hypothetical protein
MEEKARNAQHGTARAAGMKLPAEYDLVVAMSERLMAGCR